MQAAIAKVKGALSSQDVVPQLTYYLVKNGMIHASNGRMSVAAPFPFTGAEFLAPGVELEALVTRLPDLPPTIKLEDNKLRIRAGRLRGTIETLPASSVNYTPPPEDWRPVPPDMLESLRAIRPFVSDNAIHFWSLCVSMQADHMLASTNVSLARVECPGLHGDDTLVPCWAIDYVLSRTEQLTHLQINESKTIAFKWEDGSWMKTQLVVGRFPDVAHNLIAAWQEPAWEIPSEWRQAYRLVAEMSENLVVIHAAFIKGSQTHATVKHETNPAPVPEGGYSRYNPKFLNAVIDAATHWDPSTWPKPAYFSGPGIRGLIAGMAK